MDHLLTLTFKGNDRKITEYFQVNASQDYRDKKQSIARDNLNSFA